MLTSHKLFKALKPDNHPHRAAFAEEILQRIDDTIFKPSLNAVSVRRILSKLISKFTLYCSW